MPKRLGFRIPTRSMPNSNHWMFRICQNWTFMSNCPPLTLSHPSYFYYGRGHPKIILVWICSDGTSLEVAGAQNVWRTRWQKEILATRMDLSQACLIQFGKSRIKWPTLNLNPGSEADWSRQDFRCMMRNEVCGKSAVIHEHFTHTQTIMLQGILQHKTQSILWTLKIARLRVGHEAHG